MTSVLNAYFVKGEGRGVLDLGGLDGRAKKGKRKKGAGLHVCEYTTVCGTVDFCMMGY